MPQAVEGGGAETWKPSLLVPSVLQLVFLGAWVGGRATKIKPQGSRGICLAYVRHKIAVYAGRIYGVPTMLQALRTWQQLTQPSPVL